MLKNFFLIFLYHTIVHDNDVKTKDFIDVTSLIQYHLLIHVSNFDKIHRINKVFIDPVSLLKIENMCEIKHRCFSF